MFALISGLIAYFASRNERVRGFARRVAQKVSARGVSLIKEFEGFVPYAYKDIAGNWTIGYGTLLRPGHPLIGAGPITEGEAARMLSSHINRSVDPVISKWVKVPLNQNQYDALASWLYNFSENHLRTSTLLRNPQQGNGCYKGTR